ncbi:acyl carrier protein [Streptomyces sp. B6B3]|uniref:acyl carrier protein n=1 Tax=Streptomyces sp. B6B3 TaxID=3153570 RepID=UPI00325CDE7D
MTATQIQAVREQLIELLTTRFGLDEASLGPEVTFDSLELDSLALVEFSLVLQEHFTVPVGEEEVSAESTVDEVATLVADRITAKGPVG